MKIWKLDIVSKFEFRNSNLCAMRIRIDHIAKIEGHAGFTADIVNGNVTNARISVLEGARLLEGILRDRKYYEVSHITARICGVCPVVHTLTSLKALENAMNIEISERTVLLRKLLMLGQIINSHALHIFFFSLSDFFGIESDLKLIQKFPDKTNQAVAIRNFGNQIIEIIGGRAIHPITPEVGGFTKIPDNKKIEKLSEEAKKILPEAVKLATFFAKLSYPEFDRKTNFVSLKSDSEYAIYDGKISPYARLLPEQGHEAAASKANPKEDPSINSGSNSISMFMEKIKKFQVAEDAVKRTTINDSPYMVGAIARINNNCEQLNPKAKKIFNASEIKLPSQNPFHNILAQAIETIHCIEEVIKLTKNKFSAKEKETKFETKSGSGAAAIEAPRGTLFYFYEAGDNGLIKNCNIITPTAQNLARLEEDLKIWLPQLEKHGLNEKQIKDNIRMLIRAYDPCLTCATH